MQNVAVPVPRALVELINANNELLQTYQRQLTTKVIDANMELMNILGLNPNDGWRLDTEKMVYVKQEPSPNE
jgi:hypothetical protein